MVVGFMVSKLTGVQEKRLAKRFCSTLNSKTLKPKTLSRIVRRCGLESDWSSRDSSPGHPTSARRARPVESSLALPRRPASSGAAFRYRLTDGIRNGVTPQVSASRFTVSGRVVAAKIGTLGRHCATLTAVCPLVVAHKIAPASIWQAMSETAEATAFPISVGVASRCA